MSDFREQMARIELQNKEFAALDELIKRYRTLGQVAIVDDNYPECRHYYEGALSFFLAACKANGHREFER